MVKAATIGVALVALGWALSSDRRSVSWRLVAWGIGLQVGFALLVLRTSFGVAAFDAINHVVHAVLGYGEEGSRFVFGELVSSEVPVGARDASGGFVASADLPDLYQGDEAFLAQYK